MKKTLLLSILLTLNPLNADTTNMSEEDMINEIMKMHKEVEQEKTKTANLKKKSKEIKQLSKTVDKLAKKLGVD